MTTIYVIAGPAAWLVRCGYLRAEDVSPPRQVQA